MIKSLSSPLWFLFAMTHQAVRWRLSPALLLLLVAAGWLPPAARADQPTPVRLELTAADVEAALDSRWCGIYMEGKKIGYTHFSRSKIEEDGKSYFRQKQFLSLKLQSLGEKTELTQQSVVDFEAAPPFRLVRGDFDRNDGKVKSTGQLVARDNGYDITLAVGDTEKKQHVAKLDYTLADSLSSEIWLKRGPKKGESIVTCELDLETLKLELTTMTMGDAKETLVNGVKTKVLEVKSLNHASKLQSQARYDDKARLLSSVVAGLFEMRTESEKAAKKTEFSSDLFFRGLVKIDKHIGDTKKVTELIVQLKDEGKGEGGKLLPDGPRQSIVSRGEGLYELRLGKKHGKEVKATPFEIKEALRENITYPHSNPKIQELAKKAIGDATTDQEKVKRLCEFVFKEIQPAARVAMPEIHDLVERKTGDCKSYALLFTCLARASGLPCREVRGFIYIGDSLKAFGGHAWNEVVLDGVWVPVDSSWNEPEIDATHISFGTDGDSTAAILQTFGKLDLKLVHVEGGK
jgi:hypothetical protein